MTPIIIHRIYVYMFTPLSPHLFNFFELGPYYFCTEKPRFQNNVKNKCYFSRGASISEAAVPSLGPRNGEVCIFPPRFWVVLTLSSEGWDRLGVVGADLTEHRLPPPASQGAGARSRHQRPLGTMRIRTHMAVSASMESGHPASTRPGSVTHPHLRSSNDA